MWRYDTQLVGLNLTIFNNLLYFLRNQFGLSAIGLLLALVVMRQKLDWMTAEFGVKNGSLSEDVPIGIVCVRV